VTHMTERPILLVDDEPSLLHSAGIALRSGGVSEVITVEDSRAVMTVMAERDVGVVVLDLVMPHVPGQVLLDQLGADHPDVPVIVMTGTDDVATAVQCMQAGAVDYLVKPVESARLVSAVKRAVETRVLRAELLLLKDRLLAGTPHHDDAFAEILTESPAMLAIFRYLEAIAGSPQPVLITGETGTGKELMASALHRLSRRPGELVAVNVAGLDDVMFSDTLFGHTRGAFTGADRSREGLITSAAEGTIFLDEIGDLAVASQVKLLRLLQNGAYYPLGADRPRQNRARVVVATNTDIPRAVGAGRFRKDLYYRLRTHHVHLPPLRSRLGDLPILVDHFARTAAQQLGKDVPSVPPTLLQLLRTYDFPGNVRELEALVFDAIARHEGVTLSLASFRDAIVTGRESSVMAGDPNRSRTDTTSGAYPDRLPTLSESEDGLITEALRRAGGNQGVAAGLLGLSRQALHKRLSRRRERHDATGP
jgi:two-component system, NtrC family, nitrogen regulation response regulator GlnG